MSKIMSDDQLRRRKRLQGTLSTGTGALGIAAGAAAVASRGKFGKHTSKIRNVAKPATLPLTAGSAALGGVGSFNFASIQRQESKKRPLNAKNVQNVYIVRNRRQMRRLRRGMQEPNVTRVAKAEKDRSKTIGYGSTAALAGTAAISRHRIIDSVNAAAVRNYDRQINNTINAAKKSDPRNSLPKDKIGRTVYESPRQRATYRTAAAEKKKAAYRKVAAINAKKSKPLLKQAARNKLGFGASAVAIPALWMASRSSVNKKDYRKRDVDAGMAGALTGGMAYQQGSYALKRLDRKYEAQIKADPVLRRKAQDYRAKSGRPRNAPPGHKSWVPYFRNYPKDLPGGKMKRTLARTHAGKSGVVLTGAAAAATGIGALEASRRLRNRNGKNVSKAQKQKRDYSGAMVGAGGTTAGVGLVAGGIPGARPDSGRLGQAMAGGKKTDVTRHLVSGTRGGIFGYREDAHRKFIKEQQGRLKNWKPHSKGNTFERGRELGKIVPERTIVRHLKTGRTASNVALGGGLALAGTGMYLRKKNQQKKISKSKNPDYKYRSDAMIGAGGTAAGASFLGARALDNQGKKWAKSAAKDIDRVKAAHPATGGYTNARQNRGLKTIKSGANKVPNVVTDRSTGDIIHNADDVFRLKTYKQTAKAGQLRGSATQKAYFARVYGNNAKAIRRLGVGGGLALAGAGLAHRKYQVSPRNKVKKDLGGTMDFGLGGVRQGDSGLVEKSFKAYNPEHKRQRRSETAANIIAPTVSGGAAVGAGVYGVKAGRELKGARGEFRSGLANEAVRAKKVKNMSKTPKATGNYRNLAQANEGYRKAKEAARSAQKVANHPGGAANMERGFKAAKAGAKSAGKAGALGLVAVGTGLGAHRLREYQKSGKGQTYRPLYR